MNANTSSNTNITKLFSLNPPSLIPAEPEVVLSEPTIENDFTFIRKNIYEVIETGQTALASLAQIADQSQHPRAFEVLATLMKTIVESNRELLDIQKKKQDLSATRNSGDKSTVTNNLVITTAELQRMLAMKVDDGN